jgi:hypothetical protein
LNSCRIFIPIVALGLNFATATIVAADDLDPPTRVARLNLLEGTAALQPAGAATWFDDVLNRPLTSGDKLMFDGGSRAELHIGSTAIRVGERTALQIVNVGDHVVQLGLSSGALNIRVRYLAPNETVEVDTPSVAVTVLAPGEYRIDVNGGADIVDVGVIAGYAEVTGQTQDFTLNAQQQGEFSGAATLDVNFGDLASGDALDEWAAARDAHEDALLSANYVSPEVTGYEDLDDNGTWQEVPDYGPVWQPQVRVGWVPYQVGRWVWIAPWGWTWIDAAAWGFAPFHYGRWVYVNSAWCWAPGNPSLPQVYAPALVAWLGGPSLAWVALAFKEEFQPSYHASAAYVRRLNANTIPGGSPNTDQRLANQAIPGAISAVSQAAFSSGRPIGPNLVHLDARNAAVRVAAAALPPAPMLPAVHASAAVGPAMGRSSAALFARSLVARTNARRPAVIGGSPSAPNLMPAQAVPLRAHREPGPPPGAPAQNGAPAQHGAAEQTGAAAQFRQGERAVQPESRSREHVPVAEPNPVAPAVEPKSSAKSGSTPKDNKPQKPEVH